MIITKLGWHLISNIWLLIDDQRAFLMDTGHPLERPFLLYNLKKWGIPDKIKLKAVILTHRHSDHAGNAYWLKKKFDCPVICHEEDAPILSGKAPRPLMAKDKTSWIQKCLCHIEDFFPAQCPIDDVFFEGQWKWDFRIVSTPGHTEGSSMLYHEKRKVLFSGDSIVAGLWSMKWIEKLSLAQTGFSYDVERCHQHIKEFIREQPPIEMICSGHGPVVQKNPLQKMLKLL